jgi:hypothetical protein
VNGQGVDYQLTVQQVLWKRNEPKATIEEEWESVQELVTSTEGPKMSPVADSGSRGRVALNGRKQVRELGPTKTFFWALSLASRSICHMFQTVSNLHTNIVYSVCGLLSTICSYSGSGFLHILLAYWHLLTLLTLSTRDLNSFTGHERSASIAGWVHMGGDKSEMLIGLLRKMRGPTSCRGRSSIGKEPTPIPSQITT